MQRGLLLLNEALGPGVRLQRHDVRLALPGRLPDLHGHWQGHGEGLPEMVDPVDKRPPSTTVTCNYPHFLSGSLGVPQLYLCWGDGVSSREHVRSAGPVPQEEQLRRHVQNLHGSVCGRVLHFRVRRHSGLHRAAQVRNTNAQFGK